jgi:glyoxylase-like metal-dependent hydrolase (beta-lactamase superfamily II)
VPGEVIEHDAHAIGHAALLLADRGVLLAGDMLSDVLIPILDPHRPGQMDAYEAALDRPDEAAKHVNVMVPGRRAIESGLARQTAPIELGAGPGGSAVERLTSRALSRDVQIVVRI